MILKYITKYFKIIFNLLFSPAFIQRFRFIYDKKMWFFSQIKVNQIIKIKN